MCITNRKYTMNFIGKFSFTFAATLALLLIAGTVVVGSVQAQTPQEERAARQEHIEETRAKVQETRAQVQTNREARVETRCNLSTQRIELWTSRYANNQSRFQKIEERVGQTVDTVIERAKAAGKDTSELEAAVATYKTKVDMASAEYSTLISLLNDTKQYACGESEGAFKDALSKAKTQMTKTRQSVLDARTYYQQSVRTAAQALLQQ